MYQSKLKNILQSSDKFMSNYSKKMWSDIEEKHNIFFPDDYKWFISNYGTGLINDFILVFNPFSENKNINFFDQIEYLLESYLISKEYDQEAFYWSVYPEKGGLLPFGRTLNGDELYWKTDGNPNEWKIVICDKDLCKEYNSGLVELLYKILIREEKIHCFPEDAFEEQPFFKSFN